MPPQAEALPRLLAPLRLAEGLCEVVLGLHGKAGTAVPGRLSSLGQLTQLRALQLIDVAVDVEGQHFVAGLSPLTRLTRLGVSFADDHVRDDHGRDETIPRAFPFGEAISGLIHLQELRMNADTDDRSCRGMFRGSLPVTLSRLTALRHLTLLGMSEWTSRSEFEHLQTASLRLQQTCISRFESLRPGQRAELSRLVSLSLSLRVDFEECDYYRNTRLPIVVAPALTELVLDTIKLARDSEQLSWLPDLPNCGAWCVPTCSWPRTSYRRASQRAVA